MNGTAQFPEQTIHSFVANGWTRTNDLWLMRPASYHCSTPPDTKVSIPDRENKQNEQKMKKNLQLELKKLETDDYQERGSNYPKCNIPDTISVRENTIECEFKNTDEKTAAAWLERYLRNNGFAVKRHVEAFQSGDYEDDWVTASATVTGFLR